MERYLACQAAGDVRATYKLPSRKPAVPGALVVPSECSSRYLETCEMSRDARQARLNTHFLQSTIGPLTMPSMFNCNSLSS